MGDDVGKAIEAVRVEAEKMLEIPDEDDYDNDAEELCNCQFTLAYGTKILLHDTKMKLKRQRNHGLLGRNDSGKTTLMRSIANNQVERFPDTIQASLVMERPNHFMRINSIWRLENEISSCTCDASKS